MIRRVLIVIAVCLAGVVHAQHDGVAGTVHNLSVTGPGDVRSMTEDEICKFCHIPHNPVAASPLWGRKMSGAQYRVPDVRQSFGGRAPAPQPDGASRLCLSCHDGTVALGDIGGEEAPVPMVSAQQLAPGNRGFLGTDLSGSHPVSIPMPDADASFAADGLDMGLRPRALIETDQDVKLDSRGKMQCTSCHDPHSDRYYLEGQVPRFWVKPSLGEVCLTCHEAR